MEHGKVDGQIARRSAMIYLPISIGAALLFWLAATPAVGSMVIKPGESTIISMEYLMHGEMGGKHDFRLMLKTNDTTEPTKEVRILSNWVP